MIVKKIYISGKITGLETAKAISIFNKAENTIKTNFPQAQIVNPFTIPHNHNLSWESYMKEDIKHMMDCDSIYMLKNYKESKGALIEYDLAIKLGFNILFE